MKTPFVAPTNLHPSPYWRQGYEDAMNGKQEKSFVNKYSGEALYYKDGYAVGSVNCK